MKNFLKKIKTLFDKIKTNHVSYTKDGIYPSRDWKIIVLSVGFTLIVLAIGTFYFFIQIKKGKLFTVPDKDSIGQMTINNDLLKKVVDEIKLRELNLSKIKKNKITPPDPSL